MIDEYIAFLGNKTEEEVVDAVLSEAKGAGFSPLEGRDVSAGDAVYMRHGNLLLLARIGAPVLRLVVTHVDAPRIDVKPAGLVERDGLVYIKGHYYGGLKKHNWFAQPLEIRGKIVRRDGKVVHTSLPATITEFAPHLDREYAEKKVSELFDPEKLMVLVGIGKEDVLKKIREVYGVEEEDITSADLRIVPATRPTLFGANREFIMAYGHDDRACVFSALRALLDANPSDTSVLLLVDREEVGSTTDASAVSRVVELFFYRLMRAMKLGETLGDLYAWFTGAMGISADVTAAYDPVYADMYDKESSPRLGEGVVVERYTGWKGKYGGSEAPAEYVAYIRKLLSERGVKYQIGSPWKVDKGGGGTVALYFATRGVKIVDMGPPILSMHSPAEVLSVSDLRETYRAFLAFYEG